jgi:hypothetical protein
LVHRWYAYETKLRIASPDGVPWPNSVAISSRDTAFTASPSLARHWSNGSAAGRKLEGAIRR